MKDIPEIGRFKLKKDFNAISPCHRQEPYNKKVEAHNLLSTPKTGQPIG